SPMFNIFKKNIRFDLAWLEADMHSHLLYGIDDGCESAEISLNCIEGLQELGYTRFYATPHVFSEIYPNTPESILQAKLQLNADLRAHAEKVGGGFSSVELNAAAEYMIDDQFANYYEGGDLLTLP